MAAVLEHPTRVQLKLNFGRKAPVTQVDPMFIVLNPDIFGMPQAETQQNITARPRTTAVNQGEAEILPAVHGTPDRRQPALHLR